MIAVVALYALGAAFSTLYTRTLTSERKGQHIPWAGRGPGWSTRRSVQWFLTLAFAFAGAAAGHQLIGLFPAWLVALVCSAGPASVGQAVHNQRVRRQAEGAPGPSAGRR